MSHMDYEVVTGAGVTVRTFGSAALARRWVLANRLKFGPLQIDEVTTTQTRRRIYRTRKAEERKAA